jgi:hypothetical protein
MIDNVVHGTTGNLYGPVETETGKVQRLIQHTGFDEVEETRHPDTGETLVGFALPDWEEMKALCRKAADSFYGFRLQAWDIALTDRGPMLVEFNLPGDLDGVQFAFRTGVLDVIGT